jgi:hypothetical protein
MACRFASTWTGRRRPVPATSSAARAASRRWCRSALYSILPTLVEIALVLGWLGLDAHEDLGSWSSPSARWRYSIALPAIPGDRVEDALSLLLLY